MTGDKDLDAKFVAQAKAAGLENLKGHRTVGGMRASIYNAMPIEGVEKLVEFMKNLKRRICDMYKYHCLNPISPVGLEKFSSEYQETDNIQEADVVLVRSADMKSMDLPENLKAIGRAGAGVNNIPLGKCSDEGIVVFNTPGANANGVKELVIAGMLLASRDIVGGIEWVESEQNVEDIGKLAEKKKNSLPAGRSAARSWESSVWAPSAYWLPTRRPIWVWRYTDTTPTFPWRRPGIFPVPSNISMI